MHHLARAILPSPVKHLLPRSTKRILVVGAGPTGLMCADRLRHHFEVTVVDAKEYFEFTPGILRAVAEPGHFSRVVAPYKHILEERFQVEFVQGTATKLTPGVDGRSGECLVKGQRGEQALGFDYAIVAVGVHNGIWKPSMGTDVDSAETREVEKELGARRESFRSLHEELRRSGSAAVVGAGLVGVELAAELLYFMPNLQVGLFDAAPTVMPQLPSAAQKYSRQFLEGIGATLTLGEPFNPASLSYEKVLWCVGVRQRNSFLDEKCLDERGQVQVNAKMQVLHPSSLSGKSVESPNSPDGFSDAEKGFSTLEPFGEGRIFAVGDAAAVEGLPLSKTIYHGEEMAAVAVANIEAAEGFLPPYSSEKEAEEMSLLICVSLGPKDGVFSTQSEVLITGSAAAFQKQMIESTKMEALRGDPLSNLIWWPVH